MNIYPKVAHWTGENLEYDHQSLWFQKVQAIESEEKGKFHTHEGGRSISEKVDGEKDFIK